MDLAIRVIKLGLNERERERERERRTLSYCEKHSFIYMVVYGVDFEHAKAARHQQNEHLTRIDWKEEKEKFD